MCYVLGIDNGTVELKGMQHCFGQRESFAIGGAFPTNKKSNVPNPGGLGSKPIRLKPVYCFVHDPSQPVRLPSIEATTTSRIIAVTHNTQ
jgi:hypothetical protein